MLITITDITTDPRCQPRESMDYATVGEYAEAYATGTVMPPITVYSDGTTNWLADGFHRVAGARAAGLTEIEATIKDGRLRDATLHAVGANATHGLRRTNADKRRAVATLLDDDEWSRLSDREIARRCGVTHPFVAKLRDERSGNGYQMTRAEAERLTRQAAAGLRAQLEDIANEWREIESRLPPDQYRAWLTAEYGRDVAQDVMRFYRAIAANDMDEMITVFIDISFWIDPETDELYPSPTLQMLESRRQTAAR
jgi:hypothetical protein